MKLRNETCSPLPALDLSLYRPRTEYLGSRSAERKLGTQVGNRPKVSQELAPGGNMEGQEYAGVYSTGKTPINKRLFTLTIPPEIRN